MNTKLTVSLDGLIVVVGARYPFDEAHYPGFDSLTPEKQQLFALNHLLKHLVKATGTIATQLENTDHGGEHDIEIVRQTTAKLLVNALNLARVLEIDAEELATRIYDSLRP